MGNCTNYGQIMESIKKEKVHKYHTIWTVDGDNFLTVNETAALTIKVEVGFRFEYGTEKRFKNGLMHLIEHLISNKINEAVTPLNGEVTSRVNMGRLVLGLSVPYIESEYINSDKTSVEDLINILISAIREASNIDYIKDNLENEIDIIKNEIMVSEKDEYRKFDVELTNYLTRDRLKICSDLGGRYDKMDEFNDPEMIRVVINHLPAMPMVWDISTPSYVDQSRFISWRELCWGLIQTESFSIYNYNIFEDDFDLYDEKRYSETVDESGLSILNVEVPVNGIKPNLLLNVPEVTCTFDWIRNYVLNGLMNLTVISSPISMVWKEMREKGLTYGLLSDITTCEPTLNNEPKLVYFTFRNMELDNPEVWRPLFDLIDNRVHEEYIHKNIEQAKEILIGYMVRYSYYNSSIDGLLPRIKVSVKELVDRIKNTKAEDVIKYVDILFTIEKCTLVNPVCKK